MGDATSSLGGRSVWTMLWTLRSGRGRLTCCVTGWIPSMIATFSSGAGLALLSALLVGASTPFAKMILRDIDPWMLAGFLYLSSGLGLVAVKVVVRLLDSGAHSEAAIRGGGWMWLALATLSGGIIGPVLLMVGLAHTDTRTQGCRAEGARNDQCRGQDGRSIPVTKGAPATKA
jgi:hypothetical protein